MQEHLFLHGEEILCGEYLVAISSCYKLLIFPQSVKLEAELDEFSKRFDYIMDHYIDNEVAKVEKQVQDTIRPYASYVKLEKTRLEMLREDVAKVKNDITSIKAKI